MQNPREHVKHLEINNTSQNFLKYKQHGLIALSVELLFVIDYGPQHITHATFIYIHFLGKMNTIQENTIYYAILVEKLEYL